MALSFNVTPADSFLLLLLLLAHVCVYVRGRRIITGSLPVDCGVHFDHLSLKGMGRS